jgi:S1-C subfamily serine protease
MKRLIAVLAGVLAVCAPAVFANDWSEVIKRTEKSVVYLETGCTAWVIDVARHYVLTAAHCEAEKGDVQWVDRVAARPVSKDVKKDLLVLEVHDLDPARPALRLAEHNPDRGEDIMSVGYGMALERPFFRQAHVQDDQTVVDAGIGGPFISLDSAFVGGQSGGPVVNRAGEVVMIVQRASNTVGIGVGAETIRERMGRFFAPVVTVVKP